MNWMDENLDFLDAVKKAEAKGNDRIKDLQKRKIIEDKSWQSGAWWLERNYPEEFKNKTEVSNIVSIDDVRSKLLQKLDSQT